jgi:hypothetical protein
MCIRDVLVVYWWYIRLLCRRLCRGLSAELNLSAGWASPWRDVSSVMYVACIANVSGMYHGCITMVISLYLSCIMDVLVVVTHTSVFLHTLPITFLGPSLSGHPDLSISSPWVWLLLGEGSHCMAAPDMLFGRQGMHVPACPVGCYIAETTAGQESTQCSYTPCSRPETLGCCGGPNRVQKTVKNNIWVNKLMYCQCIFNVSVMYLYWVCTDWMWCTAYVFPMYKWCIMDVSWR